MTIVLTEQFRKFLLTIKSQSYIFIKTDLMITKC